MSKKKKSASLPTARDVMTSRLVTVQATSAVGDAIRLLLDRGCSGAPVVDEDGVPLGVLSEHDCIRVLAEAAALGWPSGTAADHMTKNVDTVAAREDVLAIASHFATGKHRRLLVTDEGRMIGLISRRDLLRALEDVVESRETGKSHPSTYELLENRHRELD